MSDPSNSNAQNTDPRRALWPNYSPPKDVVFSHGEGSRLYNEAGEAYLDFLSGIAVTSFGHCHPHLVEALTTQANKLWHTSNVFRVPGAERLSSRLVARSFADSVFFANSGTEAVEAGLKAIRGYHYANGRPQRYRIIGFSDSFHGRTIAALAAAGNKAHCEGFIPTDYGFDQVPWGDMDALRESINEHTAGIILEPIQGEGGIRPAQKAFLEELRALCDELDLVLMFDEVQCGIGRSGELFAHQAIGVNPDVMALAKGLGGGFPVGACLATEKVASTMVVGKHGSTFGGNPLAMAVGNAVMDLLDREGLAEQVAESSAYLVTELEQLIERFPEALDSVAGMGLMIGLKCKSPSADLLVALRDRHLLVGKSGNNMLRFLPPLNVSKDEIDEALEILASALTA